MMRKVFALVLLLCVTFFVSCNQETVTFDNVMLNLENGTYFIQVGETVYLSKVTDSNEFVIVKKNNQSEKELVQTENYAMSLNYYNGILFFLDGQKIYSYDLDSNKLKLITEPQSSVMRILVKDNFIYYIDGDELTKLDIDTGVSEVLANDANLSFDVSGDILCYQAISEEGKGLLKKIDMSDNGKTEIVYQGVATYISIESDGMYFLNHNLLGKGDNKIYKITDGAVAVPICEQRATTYNINGEKIYFSNRDDEGKLYQINKDGTNLKKVYDKEVMNVVIYGQKAFCQTRENMFGEVHEIDLTDFQ